MKTIGAILASILGSFAIIGFLTFVWLTDPAYGMTKAEVLELNETDYTDLCHIVYGESNIEPYEGQRAVVEVIVNRVMSDKFPDTVHKVLSQKGQFGTWKRRNKYSIMQSQIDAIEETRLSETSVFTPYIELGKANGTIEADVKPSDFVYFGTKRDYDKVLHKYMHNVIKIGRHCFGTM